MTADAPSSVDRTPVEAVGLGASAGGVQALRGVLGALPPDFPAAVFVVMHVSRLGTSVLPEILARVTKLPVARPTDGMPVTPGCVVVAPPNFHLRVEDGHVRLDVGPTEHGHRPAVDPLFRSIAEAYGDAACGIVLSGTRDDGAMGLAAIKERGGVALAQDPAEAEYEGMPSAAERVGVDGVLSVQGIVDVLGELVAGRYPSSLSPTRPRPAEAPRAADSTLVISCPECGGPLREETTAGTLRFRCHVGHAYGPSSLEISQHASTERAVWAAIRALDDRARVLRRLARRAHDGARPELANAYRLRADHVDHQIQLVREALLESDTGALDSGGDDI